MDDLIRTKAIEIVDDDARVVMRLSSCSGGPYIALYSPRDGLERVTISVRDGAHGLACLDSDGKVQIGLGVNQDMGTGINLFDKDALAILINVSTSSSRNVVVFDTSGNVVGSMGAPHPEGVETGTPIHNKKPRARRKAAPRSKKQRSSEVEKRR